jgi:predicted lipid carrier protein YhbT
VATQEEVDRTLRKLVKRLDGADIDDADLPEEARTILCSITDLRLDYRADYSKGRIRKLRLVEDGAGTADVKISVSSDELIALAEGKSSLPMALLFGRIRVNANARDLLLLRQLF